MVGGRHSPKSPNGVKEGEGKRSAPPESPVTEWNRRWIIISFWAVIVCLGLPHWIWTTSIHRSDLPLDVMNEWAEGKRCQIRIPIHIKLITPGIDQEIGTAVVSETQDILNGLPGFDSYQFKLSQGTHNESVLVDREHDPPFTVLFENVGGNELRASLRTWEPVLDVHHGEIRGEDVDRLAQFIAAQVQQAFEYEQKSLSYLLAGTPFMSGSDSSLSPEEKAMLAARTTRAFKFSSTYHLTFSLFSSSSSPSAWDIDDALNKYVKPLLNVLSRINRFTIDTQVQLHASLSPSIAGPRFDPTSGKWQLDRTDLGGFINAAEWPLSPSIGAGPTINFVLYIPSSEQRPLEIAGTGGTSWLIPQWGGVHILNPSGKQVDRLTTADLEPAMLTFAEQLTALVGLPPSPPSLSMRLASLTRERATSLILSASSTLGALSRLTLKLTSIAIPDTVAKSVDETILRLDQACLDMQEGRFERALENTRIANDEAERAFFEPSMVGQVYFPDEHKVAIYVPLLGPMAVALVMALLKQLRTFKAGKLKSA